MAHSRSAKGQLGGSLAIAAIAALGLALLAMVVWRGTGFSQEGSSATNVIAPGLSALTIDGNGVTSANGTVSGVSSQPTLAGKVIPGPSTIVLSIPEASLEFTAQVDGETGAFTVKVPQELDSGSYTLEINGQKVATFTVSAVLGATQLPDTGSEPGGGASLGLIIAIVAVVGVVTVTGGAFVYARSRRRL